MKNNISLRDMFGRKYVFGVVDKISEKAFVKKSSLVLQFTFFASAFNYQKSETPIATTTLSQCHSFNPVTKRSVTHKNTNLRCIYDPALSFSYPFAATLLHDSISSVRMHHLQFHSSIPDSLLPGRYYYGVVYGPVGRYRNGVSLGCCKRKG